MWQSEVGAKGNHTIFLIKRGWTKENLAEPGMHQSHSRFWHGTRNRKAWGITAWDRVSGCQSPWKQRAFTNLNPLSSPQAWSWCSDCYALGSGWAKSLFTFWGWPKQSWLLHYTGYSIKVYRAKLSPTSYSRLYMCTGMPLILHLFCVFFLLFLTCISPVGIWETRETS